MPVLIVIQKGPRTLRLYRCRVSSQARCSQTRVPRAPERRSSRQRDRSLLLGISVASVGPRASWGSLAECLASKSLPGWPMFET